MYDLETICRRCMYVYESIYAEPANCWCVECNKICQTSRAQLRSLSNLALYLHRAGDDMRFLNWKKKWFGQFSKHPRNQICGYLKTVCVLESTTTELKISENKLSACSAFRNAIELAIAVMRWINALTKYYRFLKIHMMSEFYCTSLFSTSFYSLWKLVESAPVNMQEKCDGSVGKIVVFALRVLLAKMQHADESTIPY